MISCPIFLLPYACACQARKAELELEMRRWQRALALIRRKDGDAVIDTYKVKRSVVFG